MYMYVYVVVAAKDLAVVQYVPEGDDLTLAGTFVPSSAGLTQEDIYLWRFNSQQVTLATNETFLVNGSRLTVANFTERHVGMYELLICRGTVVAVASAFYVELAGNHPNPVAIPV